MRFFYIIILVSTIMGCKQTHKEENQQSEKNERWYFWSADGHPSKDLLAVGGSNGSYLKFFSFTDLKEVKSIPYLGTITQTKWHPTKSKLAISVQDGKSESRIFNFDNGVFVDLDSIPDSGARSIGWNQSGNLLSVGDNEGFLTFFDENGEFLRKIDTDQKGLMSLDWHPEKDIVVTVGEKITLYNYETDTMKHIKSRKESMLMLCVAWHPKGEFFVTGDYGDFTNHYPPLLQYWTSDGKKIRAIKGSKAEFRNMVWSNDGEFLATASEKIRLWSKKGDLLAEKTTENLLWGIDWNEDATKLVATDDHRKIIIWDNNLERLNELKF